MQKKTYIRRRPPSFGYKVSLITIFSKIWGFFSTPPGIIYRVSSSHQKCSVKIGVLRNFTNFTRKHLCQGFFFNKVSVLKPPTLFKKRLWHRCFPVNFVKFLSKPFYIEHLWWLLFPRLLFISFCCLVVQHWNFFTVPEICLPPLCCETFFVLIPLDLLSYLEYKIF